MESCARSRLSGSANYRFCRVLRRPARRPACNAGWLRGSERIDVGELDHVRLVGFERDAAGQQVVETPLNPAVGLLAGCDMATGSSLAISAVARKIWSIARNRVGGNWPEGVDLLAYLGRETQILGVAEQIAVFPETRRDALASVVGQPGADRAMAIARWARSSSAHLRAFCGSTRRDPHGVNNPVSISARRVSSTLLAS